MTQSPAATPAIWAQESCDRRDDPVSGARIIQLTSAAAISNNVYGEQPCGTPDGSRILITRCSDYCWDEESSLLVHDLARLRTTMAVRRMRGGRGVFTSSWSGLVYFWTPERTLVQLSLETLGQRTVYAEEDPDAALPGSSLAASPLMRNDYLDRFGHAPLPAASVSPDQRYVIGVAPRLSGRGAPVFQIIRLDLHRNRRDVIFEHPEISNPHLQFDPVTGGRILVQNNEGLRLRRDNTLRQRRSVECRLFVIDADGTHQRFLPIGPPVTAGGTGHECFLGGTGRVLASVGWVAHALNDWRHSPRHPQGNLFTAAPGDRKPVCFHAPEHRFNHVSASRDGQFFVADSMPATGLFRNGALHHASLVVGCLATGRYRVLVQDSQASGGGNQCTHTHPYFTADSRHVIYNADPAGIPQVFAARLPEGFLSSLKG